MGMWFMNSKTFLDVFIREEDPRRVLTTQYVLISSRIKKTGENSNVISLHKLFPDSMILADYRADDPDYFKEEYKKQLRENMVTLAALVQTAVENITMPIVFLCTKKESKIGYLKILAEVIYEEFGYLVVDYIRYKKKKKPKASQVPDSLEEVKQRCEEVLIEESEKKKKELLSTPEGRRRYVKDMDKDELVKELRRYHFCVKNLRKSDMRELLLYFMDD